MQVLQPDEHAFFWGQPPGRGAASAPAPGPTGRVQMGMAGEAAGAAAGTAAEAGEAAGAGVKVAVAQVSRERFHSLAAAETMDDLLEMLRELSNPTDPSGLQGPGATAGGAVEARPVAALAPVTVLPAVVVEVALAKTAAWVGTAEESAWSDSQTVRELVQLLQRSIWYDRPTLYAYDLDVMGSVLWSLASVLGAYGWPCCDETLAAVRHWLCRDGAAAEYGSCTRFGDMVGLLWGYAALLQPAAAMDAVAQGTTAGAYSGLGGGGHGGRGGRGGDAESSVSRLAPAVEEGGGADAAGLGAGAGAEGRDLGAALDAVAHRMAELLVLSYGAGWPAEATDLTDAAWALSVLGRRSPATARLAEALAHEVYRQLSNRNSMQSAFSPTDLVKIVQSYARMQLNDDSVRRMLDALGGHVAKGIRRRQLHALARPADCAALLQAFADCGHNSVVVPELLAACALQISRAVAEHSHSTPRRYISSSFIPIGGSDSSSSSISSGSDSGSGALLRGRGRSRREHVPLWRRLPPEPTAAEARAYWAPFLGPAQAIAVLSSYTRMGPYYPGDVLMSSLLVALLPQLQRMEAAEVSELLMLMALVRHVPGPQALQALAAAVLRTQHGPEEAEEVEEHFEEEGSQTQAQLQGSRRASLYGEGPPAVHGLRSLWALAMMGWSAEAEGAAAAVDQALGAVLLDECAPPLSTADAGRLLSLLCLLPRRELTIQRFGLACLRLRDAVAAAPGHARGGGGGPSGGGGAWRGGAAAEHRRTGGDEATDGEAALLAAGTAMVLLGMEGWEMAEQVLPAAAFRRVESAIRRALRHPYEAVDASCLAHAEQALLDLGCSHVCSTTTAITDTNTTSTTATRSSSSSSSAPPAPAAGVPLPGGGSGSQMRPGGRYDDANQDLQGEESAPEYEPLQCAVLCARIPAAAAEAAGGRDGGAAAPASCGPQPLHTASTAVASDEAVAFDICQPTEYSSNAPGVVLWGWARVRHALYGMPRGGAAGAAGLRVVALEERALAQGGRERVRAYVGSVLRVPACEPRAAAEA